MIVRVIMMMIVLMRVVVQPLMASGTARIFAEDERFDGDRHGVGRHPDAPEIDIVEIP